MRLKIIHRDISVLNFVTRDVFSYHYLRALTSFDPGYYFLQIKNDSMTDPKQEEERAD
jgi:SOS-response transcriptional repressor LexA